MDQPAKRLERRPQVEARTGLSTSLLYAQMQRGSFPKPVRIGRKAVAWRSEDVDAWITTRKESQE